MGQRGGTRAGETVRQQKPQQVAEKFVNVDGFQVPVTDGVSSTWSTTSVNTKLKVDSGKPYAGLSKSKPIPTAVRAVHKG